MKRFFAFLLAILLAMAAVAQADAPVNINTASEQELRLLDGIGPVRAEAIISYRRENGPFLRIEDLANVHGIGQKTVDANRDRLTVGGDTLSSNGS